jgi:glutamate/tyrosine decarboxylase-like PLP-dependent enzyme
MADMLGSALNPHMGGFNQAPADVERRVIAWLRELMAFPPTASGALLSGGSMANLTGLAVALHAAGGASQGIRVYGSTETHNWLIKAAKLLGLPRDSVRSLPCDSGYALRGQTLERAILEDRQNGLTPIAAIATAGTVNTGATDDLQGIADVCERQSIWMHVDGAFGALAQISPQLRPIVKGMERADSLAFDLHKWMYLPFEIACVLVKNAEAHRATFAHEASYIAPMDRGVMAGGLPFADMGYELTRGFKALKAWMCLKAYGVNRFVAAIEENVAQAQLLVQLVEASDELELAAPAPLNVVCFRYRAVRSDGSLDDLNKEILYQLQEDGLAVPSSAMLGGQFVLRCAFVNHRTTRDDVQSLVRHVLRLGRELA